MSTIGITKTRNAQPDGSIPLDQHGRPAAWCAYCSNEGVVMLEGTITIEGGEYSRGSAPCPWCRQGELRYAEWTADTGIRKGTDRQGGNHISHHHRFDPASQFTMYDVHPTGPEPSRRDRFTPHAEWLLEREAAGIPRAALMALTPRTAWPAEWNATPAPPALVTSLGQPDDAQVRRNRQSALEAKNSAERQGAA